MNTESDGLRGIAVFALALAAFAVVGCMVKPLDRAQFEKVQLGMDEAAVEKLLGKPMSVSEMKNMGGPIAHGPLPGEEPPFGGGRPPSAPPQKMWTYMAGVEFAQVYFEDGRVFGVRFNNEFLKGDWMEGEQMGQPAVPAGHAAPPNNGDTYVEEDDTTIPDEEPAGESPDNE